MMDAPLLDKCSPDHLRCVNCSNHFQQLRPKIREVLTSKHFQRDAPDFDPNIILDCSHEHFTHLHKFEETIHGNHIFRALWKGSHIVYAVDRDNRLVFLRAFKNMKEYGRFLEDKKKIRKLLEAGG